MRRTALVFKQDDDGSGFIFPRGRIWHKMPGRRGSLNAGVLPVLTPQRTGGGCNAKAGAFSTEAL